MASDRDHQSRRDTERNGYETLRQQGVSPDAARSIARDASEQVHRNVDRVHTDSQPTKRR